MKKLLSAVTSFVMGVSLMTSAFASSVSAAGSFNTVSQPNVSMDEVIDVAANRNAADADIIFDFGTYTAKPGDTVKVAVTINTNGKPVSGVDAVLKHDAPLELTNIGGKTAAYGNKAVQSNLAESAFNVITLGGEKNDTPMVAEDGAQFILLGYKVPENCPDGVYEIGFGDKCMVFKDNSKNTYSVAKTNGTITVGNGTPIVTTTTKKPDDVTTTTVKQPVADGDIIFDFGNYEAKPGDTVKVAVTITPNGKPVAGVDAVLKHDAPLELTNIGGKTAAFGNKAVQSNLAESAFNVITLGGEKNDTPMVAEDGAQFILLGYKVPENCPDGKYEIGFGDKCMVFMDNSKNTYSVTKLNGFITVGDGETPADTTTTTKKPDDVTTTTVKQPIADGDIIFDFGNYEAKPGDTVKVSVTITPNGKPIAGVDAVLKHDAPLELTNIGGKTAAFGNKAVQSNLAESAFNVITLGGEKNDTPMVAEDGAQFILLGYKVPENCPDGKYEIGFGDKCMVFMDNSKNTYSVTKLNGFITVGDGETPADTTTTTKKPDDVTTTTTVPVTTTTVTLPPAVEGEAQWVIPTVTVKPGAAVSMDVIVKNSDIEVAGAQFHINAVTPVVYGGATGGDAYKSDLVQNDKNPEFAFGEKIGSGVKADNNAVILTLKYTAPTAPGTYPVNWSEVFVSDTNGNDITDKITCVNGAIIVEEGAIVEPDPFDGKIKWILDKKTAAPGETVTISAVVSNPNNEDVPVAGAQFDINADAPIVYNSASGTPYGNTLVKNDNTKEFAFAEANGAGVASKDGDIVISIEYTVPTDCPEGVYPVKWSDAFISDTYGRSLLDNVTLEDGSITVKKNVADGKVSWVIPEVEAAPGDTVEMIVKVSGSSDPALEVAGAQYDITVAEPIVYTSATGTPYGNALVQNDDKQKFAWAEANGAGKSAADGDVLFTLTYTVPETTADGEYPVNWADAFISDTNGNDITDKVELVNGKIIIKKDVTTTTTTEPAPDDTTTTTTEPTPDDTTTTTTEPKPDDTTTTTSTITTTTEPKPDETTTTATLPSGAIMWVINEVEAQPGEEVTLTLTVKDPNGVKLPVAGAQYDITVAEPIDYVTAAGTPYGNALTQNDETAEFAWANATGSATIAEDGELMMTLTFKVPEGTAPGRYPVELIEKFVSTADGLDMSNNIIVQNGAIIIPEPDTTTTTTEPKPDDTTTTTTEPKPDDTTTTTTEPKPDDTTTTTTEPKPDDTTTTTSTTTTTTEPKPDETTTTATLPSGAIMWVINEVEAQPGEEVTLTLTVKDPNGVKLPVAGAQYDITVAEPIDYVTAAGTPYGNTLVKNDDTAEFAWANATGSATIAEDGELMMTLTFKVPEGTAPGRYPVELIEKFVSTADGLDMSNNIIVQNGAIIIPEPDTTTTTTEPKPDDTTTTTTEPKPDDTTTTTTEPKPDDTTTTTTEPKPDDTTTTTTEPKPDDTTTTTTEPKPDDTTTTTTEPKPDDTTTTTTEPKPDDTTTTTSEPKPDDTTTTTSEPKPDDTTTTTSTTTTTTQTTPTTTTTLNNDQIVWKVDDVEAKAGETVKVQVKVEDPNATKLLISGADFTIVPGEGFVITDANGSELYAPGKLVWNPDTNEFHFSDGTGKAIPSEDGGLVLEFFVKVPDDAKPGEYPIDLTIEAVTGEDGVEYTNNNVLAVDGSITVVPSELKLDRTYAEIETQVGYYFSHDNGERDGKQIGGFNKNQVLSIKLYDVYVDEDGNEVEVIERTGLSLDNINYNGLTPQKVYSEDRTNFTYDKDVQVYYQDGETNLALVDKAGNPLYITAYIGVKGDITLDNIVNGSDATYALVYYTRINSGTSAIDPRTVIATANKLVTTGDDNLDHLAVFLADVTENEYAEDNWKLRKQDRVFNGTDATLILQFYTLFNNGDKQDAQVCWNQIVPNRFGDVAAE